MRWPSHQVERGDDKARTARRDEVRIIERAKFVVDIGEEIDDKITKWKAGISDIEKEEGVSVKLESTAAMVNIRKSVCRCFN